MISAKRFRTLLIILISIVFIRFSPFLSLTIILLTAGFSYPKTLYPFKQFKFWIPIIILMLMVPLFTGKKDAFLLGIPYSSERFFLSLGMTIRGIVLYIFFAVLTTDINSEKVTRLFKKYNLTLLDQMVSIGREVFPRVKSVYNARFSEVRTSGKVLNPRYIFKTFAKVLADFTRLSHELSVEHETEASPREIISKVKALDTNVIILVSGVAGSGKTPWLESLIKELQQQKIQVDGFISKKEIIDDENWFQNLIRISDDNTIKLNSMEPSESDPQTGKFFFNQKAFEWAKNQAVEICNADWIILDEFGPLEMACNGLFPVLLKIVPEMKCNLVLSVRPSVEKEFSIFLSSNFPTLMHQPIFVVPLYAKSPIIED